MSTKASLPFRTLLKAAREGLRDAQYQLAVQLAAGDGCEKDLKAAADWYAKAGAKRHPEAFYNLGLMHLRGEIGRPAPKKGISLIKQAADFGSWDAHWYLAEVFAQGLHGQSKNMGEAAYHLMACVGFRNGRAVEALARRLKARNGITPEALARAFLKLALPRRPRTGRHASQDRPRKLAT